MMKTNELKKIGVNELKTELLASRREYFNLRMQQATKQLVQSHLLRETRRKIARIHTLLREKVG